MLNLSRTFFSALLLYSVALSLAAQAANPPAPAQAAKPQATPAVDEWGDTFDGPELDQSKWERFTFEGGNGGTFKVEKGELRMRGVSGARSGVRSKQAFTGDHFIINATLAKVGSALPEPGSSGAPLGNAILTVLFDSSGRNRIEWLLTSEGTFEAWAMVDGRGERLDNRNLATKTTSPTLSIARRGDEYLFALNGQVGLQKTVKNLPRTFHVMLYGYGSSENNWDSVQVIVPKKS
ncbi:MAG: hypothetical protein ACJ74W_06970 [Pyrinomonadaceae bacterium]